MTDEEYRKYYKDDTVKSLIPEYRQAREELEKKKRRRTLLFLGVFFAFYFYVLYALFKPNNSAGIGMAVLISAILSCVHFYVNASMFSWLMTKNMEDSSRVEHLIKRLRFAKEREDPINAFFERGM